MLVCWLCCVVVRTEKLPQIVLDGRARQYDASWALQGKQCIHGLVPSSGFEPMTLIAHKQIRAASQCLCMLPCAFIR